MIKKRIVFLLMTACLVFPVLSYAQRSPAADKSWNAFWTQFSSAVNRKNKAAVKRLMVSEREFFSGGGGETRDEWLAMVDEQKWWGLLQKSVRIGVKNGGYSGRPSRTTRDNHLIFAYTGGRWRFWGLFGD